MEDCPLHKKLPCADLALLETGAMLSTQTKASVLAETSDTCM